MEILINEAILMAGVLTPFILILVQLVKQTEVNTKYLPHVSIVLGTVAGVVIGIASGTDLFISGLAGFLAGASASGLFDVGKNLTKEE